MSNQPQARAKSRRQRTLRSRREPFRQRFLEQLEPRCVLAATITGHFFQDVNGDQNWQAEAPHSEPAAECWTVFLDQNRNGALDDGEPSQLTALDGSYSFDVDEPGEYAVAALQEPGFNRTTPIQFGQATTAITESIQDHVFDPQSGLLYSSNGDRILRTNPQNPAQLLVSIGVGAEITALDVTPDGQFLIAGERATVGGQGRLYRIDLQTDAVTPIHFPLVSDEGGVFDLVAISNDRVLFTTESATDSAVPLREVDVTTGEVTVRSEDFGSGAGLIAAESRLERNASRTSVLLAEAHSASGPIHLYETSSDSFVASADLNAELNDAHLAIDVTGEKIAVEAPGLGLQILDSDLNVIGTPTHFAGGIAFDSVRSILYAGDTANDEFVALNPSTGSELYRVAVGEVLAGTYHEMQVNSRGGFLSVSTPTGLRFVQTDRPAAHIVNVVDGQTASNLDFGNWVNGKNRRPVGANNYYVTLEDNTLQVTSAGVLGNDSDPDGDQITAQLGIGPSFGSLDLALDGSFTYQPHPNFFGVDTFTYQVSDGEFQSCRPITVTVETSGVNDPPTEIEITGTTIPENQSGGEIGEVIVVDGDQQGPPFILISDGRFEIVDGILRLKPGVALDHEQDGTIEISITATDDGIPAQSITKTIYIAIDDVNEHEPEIDTTEIEVPEGEPTVGTIEVHDEDSSQNIEITILSGNDSGIFSIDSVTGIISVNPGFELDYEDTQIYVLTIGVSDDGDPVKTNTAEVTIVVTDSNENDPVVTPATFEIDENSPAGSIVGSVSATDADLNQTLTYSIVGGNDAGAFEIDPQTGEITVADGSQLDREQASEITLLVQATDDGSPARSGTAEVTIQINNVNEFDPVLADQTVSVFENLPEDTVLLMMTASDADAVSTIEYSLSGASGFTIDPQTGEIKVGADALDMEATQQIILSVTATDTQSPPRSTTRTVTINLKDENEFDPSLSDQSFSVPEDALIGFQISELSATDADFTRVHSYTIISGNEQGFFAVNATTGKLTVAASPLPADETNTEFVLTVLVSDGINPMRTDLADITITIAPGNQLPVANDATFTVAENSGNGTVIGTVTASDPEGTDLTYHFVNTLGPFSIDPHTGEITVSDSSVLNYEGTKQFDLTVAVTDSGNPPKVDHAHVHIDLSDVNEFAPTLGQFTFTIEENAANNRSVGIVHAFDQDVMQSLTYSISGSAFKIGATSGLISVADSSQLDFETSPVIDVTVTVTDNGSPAKSSSATVTINLQDRNEAAPVAANKTFSIVENSPQGTVLGKVTASDGDSQQVLTYRFMGGNAGGAFAIDETSGEITVQNSAALDAETIPQVLLLILVSDSGNPVMNGTATVTVNVQGVNEAPVALTLHKNTVTEHVKGATVGLVTVMDFDAGDQHTFAVDDSRFMIDASRMLKLNDGQELDADEGTQIPVEITATDSGGLSVSQNFIIHVMPVIKPWQNATQPLDVNNDGIITPGDILRVINEINEPQISTTTGHLPDNRPDDPNIPYYDVNGDGIVSPIDVLIIINEINRQNSGHQAEGEAAGLVINLSTPVLPLTVSVSTPVPPREATASLWSHFVIDDPDDDEDDLELTLDELADDLAAAWGSSDEV